MNDASPDFLPVEDVEECVSHYIEQWRGSRPMVYLQSPNTDQLEVFCNQAATRVMGRARLGHGPLATLPQWLEQVGRAGVKHCCVAGQHLFIKTLEVACDSETGLDVVRAVREGDCQASSNFGTKAEQADAEALLASWQSPGRALAIVRVLGTRDLFVGSNFKFDDEAFFASDLKSCRPVSEVYELVIPQLVARKQVEHILIDEPELFDQLTHEGSLQEYRSLFHRVGCPARAVELARTAYRDAHMRYAARGFGAGADNQPKASWLDAARARLGFGRGMQTAPSAPDTRISALALFLKVADESDISRLDKLRDVILSELTHGDDVFLRIALLVANCRLGLSVAEADVDAVVEADGEREIWWDSATTALTRAALASGNIEEWVARLGPRGSTIYLLLALESAENFDTLRGALQRHLPDLAATSFPFDIFESHVKHADEYQALLKNLEKGADLGPQTSDQGNAESVRTLASQVWAELRFYIIFNNLVDLLPQTRLEGHLTQAGQLWGKNQEYHGALEMLRAVNGEWSEAERAVADWIGAYPDDVNAWNRASRLYRIEKKWEKGVSAARQACSLDPDSHLAAWNLAYCLWQLDRDDEAVAALIAQRTSERPPENDVLLARLYYCHDRFADADTLLSPLGPDVYTAENAWRVAAVTCCRVRGLPAAQALLTSARGQLTGDALASVIEHLFEILIAEGQAKQAADYFLPILEFGEDWGDAINAVAEACAYSGRADDATALWERAQTLANCEFAYFSHASALMYGDGIARDLGGAFRVAAAGLAKAPNSVYLLLVAGESAASAGRDPISYFRKIVEYVEACAPDARTPGMTLYRGLAMCNLGDADGAITVLDAEIPTLSLSSQTYASLFRVMCAYVKGLPPTSQLYAPALGLLEQRTRFIRNRDIQHHLHDIETYGNRALFVQWKSVQAAAAEILRTSADR